MEIKTQNQQNFGWHVKTHQDLMKIALRDFPKLQTFEDTFVRFAAQPDIDEMLRFNILGNHHFYGKHRKNLHSHYKDAYTKLSNSIFNGNKTKIAEHAARTLHFLQDTTQRQHIEGRGFFARLKDLPSHCGFENYVRDNIKTLVTETPNIEAKAISYEKMFTDNIEFASEFERPGFKNQDQWEKITKIGLGRALKSTKEFLAFIEQFL